MKYIIKGSLCGHLCDDHLEWLSGMEVLLYKPWRPEKLIESITASTKETFHLVSEKEQQERAKLLVGKATTDEQGNFEFSLEGDYSNASFDIDFTCGNVPHGPIRPKPKPPIQIHLTTFFATWRTVELEQANFFKWTYCLSSKWWCYIRGHYFDAWVIFGKLRNCETGAPIANASVTAWDADFLTDDNLGTAVTDVNGSFRIDYTSSQFKQTFLSPLLNIETDPGLPLTFQSGPDVYFKASIGGVTLVDEPRSSHRKNVGYCLCVSLFTPINVVKPDEPFPSAWTGIGSAFSASFGSAPRDIDANGYAGAGKYAITQIVKLTGQAPARKSGNRVEYRFLVSHTTAANNTAPLAPGSFTKIVGVTPGLFATSEVGVLSLATVSPTLPIQISIESDQADFDANGWFDINNAIERALVNAGLTIADLASYQFIDSDTLISLNTFFLKTTTDVPTSGAGAVSAGTPVPASQKIPIEKIAIRFEVREVVNKALNLFNIMPGSDKTLNSLIINNNPVFAALSIAEQETALCEPIRGSIHAKYTVYHPHISSASLRLHSNSGTIDKPITGDGFLPLSGNTNPTIDGNANIGLLLNDTPNDLVRCSYDLTLHADARLHNGETPIGAPFIMKTFYYDGFS